MKILINTKQIKDTLFKNENEMSKMFFETENYPMGFLTGINQSIKIANNAYVMSYDINTVIYELFNCLGNIKDKNIKCGYYFVLSFLHYINNELNLSLLASKCITACYKKRGGDLQWLI